MFVLLFQFWAVAILINVADIIMVFWLHHCLMHVSTVLPIAMFRHQGWHCFILRAI